ncbi:MAG: sigma 54-interacting transcriptional regulator [Clostridia bacterium]|nr:sigma 54-interacting transcriptional regulator [Clostridia bacterium]
MNDMNTIKKTIEEVIQAINSVIQVDVTVIDRQYNRIAATGNYVDQIGQKVAKNSVFYKALNSGQEYIVESPRTDLVCQDCERKSICKEYAEVCCPIFLGDEVIGIIGLVAFDLFQREQILNNKENLLNFLKKMAGLISSKLREEISTEQIKKQSEEIEVLFNFIDSAIVSLDEKGNILKGNCKAKKLLSLEQYENISQLIHDFRFSKQSYQDRFERRNSSGVDRFLYQTRPIIIDGRLEQMVVTFSKEEDLIHVMNDMINQRQVVTFDDIIGKNKNFMDVVQTARQSSKSDSTILIQGPSGTGKELFARAIHNESLRRNGSFVAINCAAIPESLIESELFGYEEGAFTGALKGGKPGKFEIANKGTIFLDEIGDMPIHLQSKLLRVLQEREVERIGGKHSISIDVRVIAATHQDLQTLVAEKGFREDLYYRLNVIPVRLSPLRERLDDVPMLADFFLKRYNIKLTKQIQGFEPEVMHFFKQYKWQGNIREMENVIEYAVNMCHQSKISQKHLPNNLSKSAESCLKEKMIVPLEILEKEMIQIALEKYPRTKEGVEQIVNALGISRATLYRKIKYYDL